MESRDYWNRNLDTDNLSREDARSATLEENLAFAETPDFLWLCARAGDVAGRTLVDVGGGLGMHALLWARAGAHVVVADMAVERMRVMRRLARDAGLEERIVCIAAAAEALPFADGTVDFVFTKSVLIHTRLPRAAREAHRALAPGGRGLFIEPLDRNPIIRLYRALFAPREWKAITRYFDRSALAVLREPFGRLRWKPFYLLGAGSFFWLYGRRNLARFRTSLAFWSRADAWLLRRLPALETWSWFAAVEVRKDGADAETGEMQPKPDEDAERSPTG